MEPTQAAASSSPPEPVPAAPKEKAVIGTASRRKRFMMYFVILGIVVAGLFALKTGVSMFSGAQAREMSSENWNALYRDDVRQLREWEQQLDRALLVLKNLAEQTPADLTVVLTPEQGALARDYWRQVFDLTVAIDNKANFHRDFVFWLKREQRTDFIRGFLLCDAADLLVHDAGIRMAESMGSPRWERILNEPAPAFGLPESTFNQLKRQVLAPERATRQLAAKQYLAFLKRLDGFDEATADPETAWLLATADRLHETVHNTLLKQGFQLSVKEVTNLSADVTFTAWFPVQKGVANAMGNVRFKRQGVYLATAKQIEELCEKLAPGDICIARKNWYLSNAGIPGFWPHAALFLGSPEKLRAFFDDDEVRAWCAEQPERAVDFAGLLAARFPEAWQKYLGPYESDHKGYPDAKPELHRNAIIESIAPGVVFRPPVETFGADYIGVVRPKLKKVEIAQAIARAFSHAGKPYDYNFDFTTDGALVCSELVFKSYQPGPTIQGIIFSLTNIFNRSALPPNDIARKFDEDFGSETPQLDFVAFLDARESDGECFWGTLEDFRQSWRRPKWDLLQK